MGLRGWAIGVGVLVAVIGLGAAWMRGGEDQRMAETARVSGAARVAEAASATQASPGTDAPPAAASKAHELLPEGSLGQTYPTLVRLADEGNGAAALRLADLIGLCATYKPKSREKAEQDIVDGMAMLGAPRTEKQSHEQDALIVMAMDFQDRQQEACPGFESLAIGDALAEQRRWAEVAARLGQARAIVQIADALIRKYPTTGEMVEHAEELRLLRPQALAMVQRAAAMGEPTALIRMAAAHRTGDLAPVDPVEAYAWMLAYGAGPPAPDLPRIAFEFALRQYEGPLDDTQRAQARQRAEAIRAACCRGG